MRPNAPERARTRPSALKCAEKLLHAAKVGLMSHAISFRPARPEDVDAAIPLIYASGPDAFDFVFIQAARGDALRFLRRAFVDAGGEFSYSSHIVAEQGGRVVGIGAGYGGATTLPFLLAALRQIVRCYGLRAALPVIVRGLRVERVIPPVSDTRVFSLVHIAIAPELRGTGIGHALCRHLIDTGRAAGFAHFALTVSVANPRAQVLYERIGFRCVGERISRLRNAHAVVASHRQMALDASPERR